MTCPAKVSDALATLPWVEPNSIKASRDTRQVKFTVKDRKDFDLPAVQNVISRAGYRKTHLLKGPTES